MKLGAFSQFFFVVFFMLIHMPLANAQDATALKARYATLSSQLAHNQFQRPLYLESSESSGNLKGDVYALIEQPYSVAGPALQGMDHWCDILILHLNIKSCRASKPKAADMLSLRVGRKYDQPLEDAYLFEFIFKVVTAKADYLQVVLNAKDGPLGTNNYRIVLEAVEIDPRRSFLHLSYSYFSGRTARAATYVYLATIGRDKRGFSIVEHKSNGQPSYIGSTRGVVERNSMRCYLAIEAYLNALSLPGPQQVERRLNDWYSGVERYPIQLHEISRSEYLEMKHKEMRRQQMQAISVVR